MAEFDLIFKRVEEEINKIRLVDSEVQNALDRYHGRSFSLVVIDDGVYLFRVNREGLKYYLNPKSIPNDMYAKMDIVTARKLVQTQNLGFLDILRIDHRNIGLNDIQFVKQLFSKKQGN